MSLWYMQLVETNRVPDWLIRLVLRISLARTLGQRYRASLEERTAEKRALIEKLRHSPIAIHIDDPNRQHYEVPSSFFQAVLGKRLKYSCCYWPAGVATLDDGLFELLLQLPWILYHQGRLLSVRSLEQCVFLRVHYTSGHDNRSTHPSGVVDYR